MTSILSGSLIHEGYEGLNEAPPAMAEGYLERAATP